MTIRELIGQGLHYARSCKSLWLFGFVVGIASGGGNGGVGIQNRGSAGGGSAIGLGILWSLYPTAVALVVAGVLLAIIAAVVMRFVSEGALIEGVVRTRQGGRMTTREGFRAGWAHWGVLVRIALLYFGATLGSLVLLVVPCVVAVLALGPIGGVAFGIPALLVAVPWFVTLYLVQAFASRIAVLENRRARDAIRKARLFLHGRLVHGLKLLVATFLGSLGITLLAIIVIAPVALLAVALLPTLRAIPVIVLAGLVLTPVIYVLSAMLGILRSSIWTIGYVSQVES